MVPSSTPDMYHTSAAAGPAVPPTPPAANSGTAQSSIRWTGPMHIPLPSDLSRLVLPILAMVLLARQHLLRTLAEIYLHSLSLQCKMSHLSQTLVLRQSTFSPP